MSSSPSPAKRRSLPIRSRVALSLGATLVGLLALEAAVRVRHFVKHGSFAPIYSFRTDARTGLRVPASLQVGRIETDSRGFRSPEVEEPKPEGRLRIAFLGGSTTYCAEASSNAATWPALVADAVEEACPARSVDWLNASSAGYTVESSRTNLRVRVAPLAPDVIVIYHATNDLTRDSNDLAVEQGLAEAGGTAEDWLEHWSMLWEITKKNLLLRESSKPQDPGRRRLDVSIDALAAGFETRLEALVREAQQVAPVVLLVTFAHRARDGMSAAELRDACESARFYIPFLEPEQILSGIRAYNDAVRRVAARTGVTLVGGEDRIPSDGVHFHDSVHLLDPGCRLQADRVTESLVTAPSFRALCGG
jgi:lysophospholipase L1-like esterase